MDEHAVLILLGIAGVAATFAGFSGVVSVFERRAHGDWLPEERFRLINMLIISLSVCLFAFVPLEEGLLHVSEPALWVTASVFMGAFCVAYILCALPYRLRIGRLRHSSLPVWVTAVFILALNFAAVLQFLNATAILVECGAGPYVAGLLLLLFTAGLQFALLVLAPLSPGNTGDRAAKEDGHAHED